MWPLQKHVDVTVITSASLKLFGVVRIIDALDVRSASTSTSIEIGMRVVLMYSIFNTIV